jgi:hypothetical protein
MENTRYNEFMTRATIIALIAAIAALIALMTPEYAHAKAQGDSIGAPTKAQTTGASRADMADAPLIPAYFYSAESANSATTTATSTERMTRAEKRAHLKALKAEIKRLEKIIKELKRSL